MLLAIGLGLALLGGGFAVAAGASNAKKTQQNLTEDESWRKKVDEVDLAQTRAEAERAATALDSNAALNETVAKGTFTATMGDAFIQQKQSESQYRDMLAEGVQATSSQVAVSGLSGVKNTGTTQLLGSQTSALIGEKTSLARKSIDQGIKSGVARASLGLQDSLGSVAADRLKAGQIREDVTNPGSSWMQSWQVRQDAAVASYERQYDNAEYSFLRGASDFFGGANAGWNLGSSIYSSGKAANWKGFDK